MTAHSDRLPLPLFTATPGADRAEAESARLRRLERLLDRLGEGRQPVAPELARRIADAATTPRVAPARTGLAGTASTAAAAALGLGPITALLALAAPGCWRAWLVLALALAAIPTLVRRSGVPSWKAGAQAGTLGVLLACCGTVIAAFPEVVPPLFAGIGAGAALVIATVLVAMAHVPRFGLGADRALACHLAAGGLAALALLALEPIA